LPYLYNLFAELIDFHLVFDWDLIVLRKLVRGYKIIEDSI